MQWLLEHLATEYGALGVLVAVSWAWTLLIWRRLNYSHELCLRLQEQRLSDQSRLVERQFSELNRTAERLAKAYATASPSTVLELAQDIESDFSVRLSDAEITKR